MMKILHECAHYISKAVKYDAALILTQDGLNGFPEAITITASRRTDNRRQRMVILTE